MPAATQLFPSFLGGEISQYAQGRYDREDYRTSMRVCLNSFPMESGAWTRRPGTQYSWHTRTGVAGRVIKFDFEQSLPVTMELTDGWVRFRTGTTLITGNDIHNVVSVSTANPAVVETATPHGWSTGNQVYFSTPSSPGLERRQFVISVVDTTHFSLIDALYGGNVDGSTLGTLASGAIVWRIHELQTPYSGTSWSTLRVIQAETSAIMLNAGVSPYILTTPTLPGDGIFPQFALTKASFTDGPYLDPPINGAALSPVGASGIVTLTVSFQVYDATKSYALGEFVSYSGSNYVSLSDQNVGHSPDIATSWWALTNSGAAINDGRGFLGTDVGRLVRLFSEPAPYSSTGTYAAGQIVSYNPSGIPGATTYWKSLTSSNSGHTPGTDATNWQIVTGSGAALWTWGRITGLSNSIPGATGSPIGWMSEGAGLAAAFDGNFSKTAGGCAEFTGSGGGTSSVQTIILHSNVGKFFNAGAQQILHAAVYPSSDLGWGAGNYNYKDKSGTTIYVNAAPVTFTINLRASAVAPSFPSDGTLLATWSGGNSTAPINLTSSDQGTAFSYIWIEVIAVFNVTAVANSWTFTNIVAQVVFFGPEGSTTNVGVNAEILGPALLYSSQINTWRLGLYSDTTGWPTVGCYDGGRLFLGGAVPNRWDASVSNGINNTTINFAPTDQFGDVLVSSAISATFNSDDVNPILWMIPVLEGVLMGTQGGEWLVQAPTSGPLAPTNMSARRVTRIGSENVEPRRTEHTNIFVRRYGLKLMEYFADVFSGKFSAPNLADKAQHITKTAIEEIAYTGAANPIIWGRCGDGSLFGVTYKRNTLSTSQGPTFYAWHRHALGTGRTVESICSGPSAGGSLDALTMVTREASTNIHHVEILTDVPDEVSTLASAWFLDDAITPSSLVFSNTAVDGAPFGGVTINGLWHLNGKTVQVFAGGLDCGDRGDLCPTWQETKTYQTGQLVTGQDGNFYTALKTSKGSNPLTDTDANWQIGGTDYVVSNGAVFVPYGDGISSGPGGGLFTQQFVQALPTSQIVIGMTYNSDGQIVRLVAQADTGARNGPALGAPSRTHRAALKLVNTRGIAIGGSFSQLFRCELKESPDSSLDLPALALFTGMFYDQVQDSFSYDNSLCWRVSRPFPATVTACAQNLRTEDM